MKIYQLGESTLEEKSKEVQDINSPSTQNLIKEMLKICATRASHTGGLAAPQLGVNKCIVIIRRADIEEEYEKKNKKIPKSVKNKLWMVLINPRIIKVGKKQSTYWEGCLSVADGKLFGPVTRSSYVKISFLNAQGTCEIFIGKEYMAHIIQHEIDHLNGLLFIKYVKNPANLWDGKKLDRYITEHGEMPGIE